MKYLVLFTLLCTTVHACSVPSGGRVSDQQLKLSHISQVESTEQIRNGAALANIFRKFKAALQRSKDRAVNVTKLELALNCWFSLLRYGIDELSLERDFGRSDDKAITLYDEFLADISPYLVEDGFSLTNIISTMLKFALRISQQYGKSFGSVQNSHFFKKGFVHSYNTFTDLILSLAGNTNPAFRFLKVAMDVMIRSINKDPLLAINQLMSIIRNHIKSSTELGDDIKIQLEVILNWFSDNFIANKNPKRKEDTTALGFNFIACKVTKLFATFFNSIPDILKTMISTGYLDLKSLASSAFTSLINHAVREFKDEHDPPQHFFRCAVTNFLEVMTEAILSRVPLPAIDCRSEFKFNMD